MNEYILVRFWVFACMLLSKKKVNNKRDNYSLATFDVECNLHFGSLCLIICIYVKVSMQYLYIAAGNSKFFKKQSTRLCVCVCLCIWYIVYCLLCVCAVCWMLVCNICMLNVYYNPKFRFLHLVVFFLFISYLVWYFFFL